MRKITLFACITLFISTCRSHAQNTNDAEIHLVFFTSFYEQGKNVLNWATKKMGKYTFTLELSADSIKFYSMSLWNIYEEKSKLYEFVDPKRNNLKTYYRLRVFNKKGKLVEERCICALSVEERIVKRPQKGSFFCSSRKSKRVFQYSSNIV